MSANSIENNNAIKIALIKKKYPIDRHIVLSAKTSQRELNAYADSVEDVGDAYVLVEIRDSILRNMHGYNALVIHHQDNFVGIPPLVNCKKMLKAIQRLFARGYGNNECAICATPSLHDLACQVCFNSVCISCIMKVNKCPFCRTSYLAQVLGKA